jgi:nucleolin
MESDNEKIQDKVSTKTVFISGLPYETTEEELRQLFEGCGIIKEIKIPKYQDTGRNIGYAHLSFKKNKGVTKVTIFILRSGIRIKWNKFREAIYNSYLI